jgi:hypothetical protein
MNKLSSTKVAEVLAQVPVALRAQQEEIAQLKEKIAHYEKRDRVIKIASAMQTKNLDPDTSYDEKVENLMGFRQSRCRREGNRILRAPGKTGRALRPSRKPEQRRRCVHRWPGGLTDLQPLIFKDI